jgi:hypothetical protein
VVLEPLRPARGGFLKPFGCGWFIREFLLGHSPDGSPKIDPDVGAPQTDIHRYYKEALHRAYAEDMVAWEEEERIRKKLAPLTIEEAEERTTYYLERIPYKLTRMRYASFTRYFSHLKRLGYVEETGTPELTQLFCEVDIEFFSQAFPEFKFHRGDSVENTVAYGKDHCDFIFEKKS